MTDITLSPASQTPFTNLTIKPKQNIESATAQLIITLLT